MHLTNFSLNKTNKENFIIDNTEFLEENNASKRLLSKLYLTLERSGIDLSYIERQIEDTVAKCVIAMEPYLSNIYRTTMN